MSEEGLYKPSPLIQKIISQKFPKLNSESLKTIVDRARQMTKLTQPSNCSQNLKAEFQDPEKALEYSRRKNMIFDSYLKHELSQLHCSKSPVRAPVKTRRRFFKSYDLSASPLKSSIMSKQPEPGPQSGPQAGPQLGQSILSRVNPRGHNASHSLAKATFASALASYQDTSSIETFEKTPNERTSLPPLIKSIPLYLDPKYMFHKKDSVEEAARREQVKHIRVSSLDSVEQQCQDFIPDCKTGIEKLRQAQTLKQQEGQRIQEYMEDFSDCLRIAQDQKTFEDSMSTKIYNRKLNSGFREELESLRSDLLEVTKRAIDLSGKKIWRWKNTLFLANADKLINSVPTMRK